MALIGASRLLLAYGIDYAARVQNGYVSPGTGGHARPPQELENGPVSSENVPASARASPTCRPLVMKGSPVRVRASALQAVLQGFLPPPATPERTLRVRNRYIFDRFRFQVAEREQGPTRIRFEREGTRIGLMSDLDLGALFDLALNRSSCQLRKRGRGGARRSNVAAASRP